MPRRRVLVDFFDFDWCLTGVWGQKQQIPLLKACGFNFICFSSCRKGEKKFNYGGGMDKDGIVAWMKE